MPMDRKIKKWSHKVTHEDRAGRPSTATTDGKIDSVHDVTLLDRGLTVGGAANSVQVMKSDVIVIFLFLLK
jgi:hypothetical protein